VVRKKKKVDEAKKQILRVLKTTKKPMATQELADKINRSWHSVQTRCLRLQIDGKITGFRVGNINLWQIIGGIL
jgi:DNA-binding Lrp family transcriptional regulator